MEDEENRYHIVSTYFNDVNIKGKYIPKLFGVVIPSSKSSSGLKIAKASEMSILILDSQKKGRTDQNFEQFNYMLDLFTYAISDLIIIQISIRNLERIDLSRLLTIILRINEGQEKTSIAIKRFVLFVEDGENEREACFKNYQVFKNNLRSSWEKLSKAKEFLNDKLEMFLSFDLIFVEVDKDNQQTVDAFVERLNKPDRPNYIFKNLLEVHSVPLAALGTYLESLWVTVLHKGQTREPLELFQKRNAIISAFMEEMKTKVYRSSLLKIIKLKEQARNNEEIDLNKIGLELIESAKKAFQGQGSDFMKVSSYKKLLKELEELINEDLLEIFHIQLNNLQENFLPSLQRAFKDESNDWLNVNAKQHAKNLQRNLVDQWYEAAEKNKLFDSKRWSLESYRDNIECLSIEATRYFIEDLSEKWLKSVSGEVAQGFSQSLGKYLSNIDQDFWVNMRMSYVQIMKTSEDKFIRRLQEDFEWPEEILRTALTNFRESCYKNVFTITKETFLNLSDVLIKGIEKEFSLFVERIIKERKSSKDFNYKKFLVDQMDALVNIQIEKLSEIRKMKIMSDWDGFMFVDFSDPEKQESFPEIMSLEEITVVVRELKQKSEELYAAKDKYINKNEKQKIRLFLLFLFAFLLWMILFYLAIKEIINPKIIFALVLYPAIMIAKEIGLLNFMRINPSPRTQFDLNNLTGTQKLLLASSRIFGHTFGGNMRSGTKPLRSHLQGVKMLDKFTVPIQDISMKFPLITYSAEKARREMMLEQRKLRIMMRGVKIGKKKGGAKISLMNVFEKKAEK